MTETNIAPADQSGKSTECAEFYEGGAAFMADDGHAGCPYLVTIVACGERRYADPDKAAQWMLGWNTAWRLHLADRNARLRMAPSFPFDWNAHD